jgi:hypothetical protein
MNEKATFVTAIFFVKVDEVRKKFLKLITISLENLKSYLYEKISMFLLLKMCHYSCLMKSSLK